MAEVRIAAESRTEFGKGAARRVRRESKVPAVLYGHGTAPRHLTLPGHELMLALKTPNVLLTLEIEGGTELALPKDVQRDPIKGFLRHVDLVVVNRGEKVVVDVAITTVGELPSDAILNLEHATIPVEAEATHIPTEFEVDLSSLSAGDHVTVADLTLPEGVVAQLDPETIVLAALAGQTAAQADAELAEAEAEAGIVHEEKSPEASEA